MFVGSFFLGEDDHAFIIFQFFEEDFDLVTDLDVFVFEFVGGDGSFGLVSDVHEDDLWLDFEDLTFDDGSFGEFTEGSCDHFPECLGAH